MLKYENFKQAIENYVDKHEYPDPSDMSEMIKWNRTDIFSLSDAFYDKFGFRLLDIEIQIIWKWHSVDWNASWLIVGENPNRSLMFFEDFVTRFE